MWTAIALSVMLSVPGLAQVPAGSRDSISISIEMQRDMRALAGSADSLVCEGPSEQAGAGGRICTKPGRNSVLAVVRSDREFAFVTRWLELKSETEVPATDSTLALLEVAYGSPTMCARDAFRFPAYPQHYLWHRGDFTIQLVSTAPSSPRHPILSVQIARGPLSCSDWARPPTRHGIQYVDVDTMKAVGRQLESWAARAGTRVGDTAWEAAGAAGHRVVARRVTVPGSRLVGVSDSTESALDRRLGVGGDCFPDPYRRVPPRLYRQWNFGDYTIRLQRDTVHPAIVEQIIDGPQPCGSSEP